jgi:hypothetical protein
MLKTLLLTLLNACLSYGLKRLKEPSTWTGLALGATAVGVQVSPELQDSITTLGIGAAGLISAVLPDRKGQA